MRLAFISDTHELHDEVAVPACDVLVCCGDFTNHGRAEAVDAFASFAERALAEWPVRHVVVIAGNHDLCFDPSQAQSRGGARERARAALERAGAVYLEDEARTIEGVMFYGSPWSMRFYDWAFPIDDEAQDERIHSRIPEGVDVLVTHGPPLGILDRTYDGRHVGSPWLARTVERLRPRVHAFGHIHESYGVAAGRGTTYVNASTCTVRYEPTNPPIVVTLT